MTGGERSTTTTNKADKWTKEGENFSSNDAEVCPGAFAVCMGDFLTFHGSVVSLTPEQGEGKRERGAGERGEEGDAMTGRHHRLWC